MPINAITALANFIDAFFPIDEKRRKNLGKSKPAKAHTVDFPRGTRFFSLFYSWIESICIGLPRQKNPAHPEIQ